MKTIPGFFMCLAMAGCLGGGGGGDDEEDEDVVAVDPSTITVTTVGVGGPLPLSQVLYWSYVIQDHFANPQALVDSHYDLMVIDQARSMSDYADYNDALLVQRLKESANHVGGNKVALCYVNIGEAEDYRWYWQEGWGIGQPSFILGADPDGWEGNYPVKYWDSSWKQILYAYLNRIIDDGYDGVYLDWLLGYELAMVQSAAAVEGRDAVMEMVQLVKDLADYARSLRTGFLIVAQNGAALGSYADYLAAIDAQAQEDVWFSGGADGVPGDIPRDPTETEMVLNQLAVIRAQRKPIFTVDYATIPANVATAYTQAGLQEFIEYVTTVELDVLTATPPPGY